MLGARTALTLTAGSNWLLGEPELRLLPSLCDKTRTALDVGANFGVYTYYLSRFSLDCIAFEPNPVCASFLRRVRLNKVSVEEVALSSSEETRELLVPKIGHWHVPSGGHLTRDPQTVPRDEANYYFVKSTRLDEYGFSQVGMIKIDTEGHETEVILGGIETIRKSRPRILVECEERHKPNALMNVLSLLSDEGHQACCLVSGRLTKFNSQNQGYAMNSSGNFIFIHSSDPDSEVLLG